MKTSLLATVLFPALATLACGQVPAAPASAPIPAGPLRAKALLIEPEGGFTTVWLTASTKTAIRYYEAEGSVESVDKKISDFDALYIYEPRELTTAFDLYQSRKYAEAKAKFIEVKERYKPILQLENSPAAQAGFYELECLRRLGDLEGLAAANSKFIKDPLTRDTQLRQIELYVLWDAVRTKSWDRLLILTTELEKTKLPMEQRTQVAYCQGLALEELKKPNEAMFAYQTAITADVGATEELTRQAAIRVLTILQHDEGVKIAMKVWGTQDENRSSRGYERLLEAHGVAKMFELSLGAGTSLPPSLKIFLKYEPKADVISEGSDAASEGETKKAGNDAPPVPGAPVAPVEEKEEE